MKIPTIVEAVLSEVRRRILDGSCAPGDRLNVDELARELKVSKTPIREARGRLAREGFVKSEARIGWSVMLLSLDEFFQMQEIQHALKSYVMDRIAPYVSGIDIEKAVQFNNNMQHFLKTGQNHRALEENDKFHRAIFSVYPNKMLLEQLEEITDTIRLQRISMLERKILDPESPILQHAPAEHEEIIDALRSGDQKKITDSSMRHQKTILDTLKSAEPALPRKRTRKKQEDSQ